MGNILYLSDRYIFAVLLNNISLLLMIKLTSVAQKKKDSAFCFFFYGIFLSCKVPTFRGQTVVKHGGHRGISFFIIV